MVSSVTLLMKSHLGQCLVDHQPQTLGCIYVSCECHSSFRHILQSLHFGCAFYSSIITHDCVNQLRVYKIFVTITSSNANVKKSSLPASGKLYFCCAFGLSTLVVDMRLELVSQLELQLAASWLILLQTRTGLGFPHTGVVLLQRLDGCNPLIIGVTVLFFPPPDLVFKLTVKILLICYRYTLPVRC